MADRKTQVAGHFRKTVGAGLSSIMGSKGRTYFLLEMKEAVGKMAAGKTFTFTSDYIELGRSATATMNFADNLYVSRMHAAIVKEGAFYFLKNFSKTNPTLLNGAAIEDQHILKNGDEIQLSMEGPKMGFLLPPNNTANSLPLSIRMQAFAKGAIQPYKKALLISSCFFLLILGGVGYWLFQYMNKVKGQSIEIAKANATLATKNEKIKEVQDFFKSETACTQEEITILKQKSFSEKQKLLGLLKQKEEELHQLTIERNKNKALQQQINQLLAEREKNKDTRLTKVSKLLKKYEADLYEIEIEKITFHAKGVTPKELAIYNRYFKEYKWQGTGFLLNDGRFFTTRQVIQPWLYLQDEQDEQVLYNVLQHNLPAAKITVHFLATAADGTTLRFNSQQFKTDETPINAYKIDFKNQKVIVRVAESDHTNWTSVQLEMKGEIAQSNISLQKLPPNTKLYTLESLGGKLSYQVSIIDKTKDHTILLNRKNILPAAFGSPAFIEIKGRMVFVGMLSSKEEKRGMLIAIP